MNGLNKHLDITLLEENILINNFSNLIDKELINNSSLINEEKQHFLGYFNVNTSKTPIFTTSIRFGNQIPILNKVLFYSEILGYNYIILNKNDFWFIKNTIYIEKYNLTIEVDDINLSKKKTINKYINNINYNIIHFQEFYYYFFKIKPEIRINYLREELLSYLPSVITFKDNLYIHVRSGDIFTHSIHKDYAQPPLCFYKKILNNYKFKKVFLLSNGDENPIINHLIKEYPIIIFNKNSIEVDISSLLHAYNIISSISSFLISILQFNHNLKHLYDYNIYKNLEKIYHFHYDLYKYPHNNFTIFRMEPSYYYRDKMYKWKNNKKQRKMILNDICLNNFKVIKREN